MTGTRHCSHLERAERLIADAGKLLHDQRPLTVAAALTSESAPMPVWALDRDHQLLWGNREFEARFGVRALDERGQTPVEIWGLSNEELLRDDEVIMATGRASAYTAVVDDRVMQVSKWPLLGEDGSVIGLCVALT